MGFFFQEGKTQHLAEFSCVPPTILKDYHLLPVWVTVHSEQTARETVYYCPIASMVGHFSEKTCVNELGRIAQK